jgi:L-cysteine S-thiosulfotransferase
MKRQMMLGAVMAALIASAAVADTATQDVQFAEGAVAQSLTGVPGDAASGKKVASTRPLGNCVACHVITAMPEAAFQGNIGPALDGVASRYDEAQLRGIVSNAKMMFEGTMMPAFYKSSGYIRPGDAFTGKAASGELPPLLTAQQVEDVVAYLLTLKE